MGIIYIIKNSINEKVYIGQTSRTLEIRWKEYLRHYKYGSQAIYTAMRKYGIDHFFVEKIEECEEDRLDEREMYWIQHYDSFNNGYNSTLGGRFENMATNRVEEVLQLWEQGNTVNKIVEKTSLNVETVRGYLNKNNIGHSEIRERANKAIAKSKSKPVFQYDRNHNFIKEWESTMEIERELGINHRNVSAVCNGKRKTAGNYFWTYERRTNEQY